MLELLLLFRLRPDRRCTPGLLARHVTCNQVPRWHPSLPAHPALAISSAPPQVVQQWLSAAGRSVGDAPLASLGPPHPTIGLYPATRLTRGPVPGHHRHGHRAAPESA